MTSKTLLSVIILGALIVGRMTMVYAGQDWIGFAVTLAIAFGFVAGLLEVARRAKQVQSLHEKAESLSQNLASGETQEPPRDGIIGHYIQARLVGGAGPLPTLTLTPYLMGLMVMLGLLGTFLGLVETLEGARKALAVNTELSAVRLGLTQPIQGLSRAFGTSVAGVATSALLGYLLSQFNRHKLELKSKLDQLVIGPLNHLTFTGRQTASMETLADRLNVLPAVTSQIETLCDELRVLGTTIHTQHQEGLENNAQSLREGAESIGRSLTESAEASHQTLTQVAGAMERSIQETSQQSAELIRTSIQEALEGATAQARPLVNEVLTQARESANQQFEQWNQHLNDTELSRTTALLTNLDERSSELVLRTEAALDERSNVFSAAVGSLETQMTHLVDNVSQELSNLSATQHAHQESMTQEMGELDKILAHHLDALSSALSKPLAEVMDSVAEAPQAARQVIDEIQEQRLEQMALDEEQRNELLTRDKELRTELLTRDNTLLSQREELLGRLNEASTALESSMHGHHELVEKLVEKANAELEHASERNFDKLEQSRAKLEESAAMVATGGVEMAAVATMFSTAVESYTETSDKLLGGLEKIEEALNDSGERSNQQLSLYVDQAREIIDQSLLSQREIFEALRTMQPQSAEAEALS